MAEVLTEFADILTDGRGASYRAQACGAEMPGGTWQGWIEFVPLDGAEPVRSGRETTQPNRADTHYWATGLTRIYLEGALRRALEPSPSPTSPAREEPFFDAPAPRRGEDDHVPVDPDAAVLDPFSVYQKGEMLLRKQLGALARWHLVNIIRTFHLSDKSATVLSGLPSPALIDIIVTAVAAKSERTRA